MTIASVWAPTGSSREIQRAILLNRIRGLGKEHHTAIFPKLVFTIKHGVNAEPG